MARKKKSEGGLKAADDSVAASEPKGAGRAREAQAKVAGGSEAKSDEVIPAVAIALLEAHPQLPDGDAILAAFAEHYRETLARAAELAAAPPPEPEPAPAPPAKTGPHARPARAAWVPPTLPPMARPVVEPEPEPELAPLPELSPEPLPDALDVGPSTDHGSPAPFSEPEASSVFADDVELFGDTSQVSDDDIFAALAKGDAKSDDDLGFTPASDYSDPFIRTAAPTPGSDPFIATSACADADARTTAIPAFDDIEAAIPEEAGPTDRTTMIQAMPDDEPAEGGESAEAPESTDDGGAKGGRRSRKAKKKK
ncbi:MAG: hypothetical protein U1F43_27835 [Myxococcota bacterium]